MGNLLMASTRGIRAGRAFVELFADDSKLVRGLRRAQRRVKAFGKHISQLGRKLAGIGATLAAPIALSTRVFAGFDDQMRSVQAVLGATGSEFDRLNEKAKELGRTTSYTAAQVAGAMLELGRAGFDPKEIDSAIGSVLALARATGTELPASATIAADFAGALGVTHDNVEGVDITVPVYHFAETHYLDDAVVTPAYRGTLFGLTGKVNNASFKGLAAGECLFLGASGSKRGEDDWEISFRFAGSPNRTDIQVGPITVASKKGWEYLWARYADEEDAGSSTLVKRPIAAYVEKVYENGDFSALGIGT